MLSLKSDADKQNFLTSVSQRKQVKRVIKPVRSINIPKHSAIPL